MERYLIAVAENGVYLRETLCVTHHGDTGEVTYDTKPVKELPAWVIEKIKSAQQSVKRTADNVADDDPPQNYLDFLESERG